MSDTEANKTDEVNVDVKDEELEITHSSVDTRQDPDVEKKSGEEAPKKTELTGGLKIFRDALGQFSSNRDEDVTVYHVMERCTKVSCYLGIDEAGRGPVLGTHRIPCREKNYFIYNF